MMTVGVRMMNGKKQMFHVPDGNIEEIRKMVGAEVFGSKTILVGINGLGQNPASNDFDVEPECA